MDIEIRLIEISKLTKLSSIIDTSKDWSKLIEGLSRPEFAEIVGTQPLNLSLDSINLIDRQVICGKSPTLTLLNYWSITGRRRPTIDTLIKYLRLCGLRRAENFVYQSILGIAGTNDLQICEAQQVAETQPSAREIGTEYKFDNLSDIVGELNRYSFQSIYESTNSFCHQPYDPINKTGTLIGKGRFSSVYKAKTKLEFVKDGDDDVLITVAAKLLKSDCNYKYLANELQLSTRIKQDSILELLGIALGPHSSQSPEYICLIYDYIENGSLLGCLEDGLVTRNMNPLQWKERINIALKVAQAISYLHNFKEGSIVHRDIKTANIFIDSNIDPKVGDFTLVRQFDPSKQLDTQYSQNIIGTSVYMPPEAFRGDISLKFDCFSYGIVLLEILTGMKPFNEQEDEDILTYINNRLSDIEDELDVTKMDMASGPSAEAREKLLLDILDPRAGDWNMNSSKVLFELSLRATESKKRYRVDIDYIVETIQRLL